MATHDSQPLIVRTRVTPWGYLVALPLACGFAYVGALSLEASLLPRQLGIFVEPPPWLMGLLLLGFALFLFLVGVAELARYVKPSVEVIVDRDGIATFGVLGERRLAWRDITGMGAGRGLLSLKVQGRGRMPPPELRIHFNRLDLDPRVLLARIRAHRPDLDPPHAEQA